MAIKNLTVRDLSQRLGLSTQRILVLLKELKLKVEYVHRRMVLVPESSAAKLIEHVEKKRHEEQTNEND